MTVYQAAFTASRRPQALLTTTGRLSDANPAFCSLAGRHRTVLLGAPPDFIAPLRDGPGELVGPAGERRPVTIGLVPLPHGATLIDLEAGAESHAQAVERSNRALRAIIENTYEFIGLLSPDGRLIEANHTALSFLGLDEASSLVGMPFPDTPWWTHSPDERTALARAIERAQRGEFVRFETTHRGEGGRMIHIDFSLKPVVDAQGAVAYLVPEGRDITARKEAETALLAAKIEAESANRAKSTFLATVSHELRTPLNAVVGFSEAILSSAVGPFDHDRTLDYLRMIHEAGQHLGSMIEDILDVSRVELGHLDLADDRAAPAALIGSVCRLTEHTAIESGIRLATDCPPGLPVLRGDARRLRQILLNLVTNALKFTPSGGTVTLRAGLRPQGFAFEVEDTGIGIPAEHLSRVWQPFFQSDATLARQRHGAGLGLAIVRHFVEAHDGEVYIDSEPGQGTRVGLLLPPTRIEAAASP